MLKILKNEKCHRHQGGDWKMTMRFNNKFYKDLKEVQWKRDWGVDYLQENRYLRGETVRAGSSKIVRMRGKVCGIRAL